jgi:hypothetical protein
MAQKKKKKVIGKEEEEKVNKAKNKKEKKEEPDFIVWWCGYDIDKLYREMLHHYREEERRERKVFAKEIELRLQRPRRSSSCHMTLWVRRVCAPTLYCVRLRPVVSSSGKRPEVRSCVGTYSVM